MGQLSKSLRETLKKLAYSTSVDQLKKRGVKEVNVVGLDRVTSLIEEAVYRSLRNRMVGLDREQVADATASEFLRLLRSNRDLEESHAKVVKLKERAQAEVDELRLQLAQQKKALAEKLAEGERELRAHYEGENSEIIDKVNATFVEFAANPDMDNATLRDRVVELVMDIVGDERAASMQARQAAQDQEVEQLRRRINKLSQSLEETESRLAHVAALKDVDAGISSVYREVQGLSASDKQFERKRELMADIFSANLRLQKGAAS